MKQTVDDGGFVSITNTEDGAVNTLFIATKSMMDDYFKRPPDVVCQDTTVSFAIFQFVLIFKLNFDRSLKRTVKSIVC